jgi:hypothetical protein
MKEFFNVGESRDKDPDSKYQTNLKFCLDCIILLLAVLLLTLILFRTNLDTSYTSITSSNLLDEPCVNNVMKLLTNLEEIARDNGGSRSIVNGHSASVDFVLEKLEQMSERYLPITQPVSYIGRKKFL